jgi:hypothetical protein
MTLIVNGFTGLFLLTGGLGDGAAPVAPFVVFVDPRAAQLVAASSDSDPFGVDPRAAQLVSASSDADPFGVDPRAAVLVS